MVLGCWSVAIGDVVELVSSLSCVLIYVFLFNYRFPLWPHLVFVSCAKSSHCLSPCHCVSLYHPIFGPYCSADLDRRSLAISNRNRSPTRCLPEFHKNCFWCPTAFDCDRRFRIFRLLTDCPLELRLNVTTHRVIRVSAITMAIPISIVRSVARSLCCATPNFLKIPQLSCFDKLTKVIQYLSNNNHPPTKCAF